MSVIACMILTKAFISLQVQSPTVPKSKSLMICSSVKIYAPVQRFNILLKEPTRPWVNASDVFIPIVVARVETFDRSQSLVRPRNPFETGRDTRKH